MTAIELHPDQRVYVAGHNGLVGQAVWRTLQQAGFRNLVGWRSAEVDLKDRDATFDALRTSRPDVVVDAAARVGGILANSSHPVDFLQDNLAIQGNLFAAAHDAGVQRLLFLGSSCIYPKFAEQPIREDSLLTGPLEPTNEAYAIAKITGVLAMKFYRQQYGRQWISAMPTNLYGPGDNFDLQSSHVLPAMIRKFHEAKASGTAVQLWGTGSPRREFLHTDDVGTAVLHLLRHYDEDSTINIGTGKDISIKELALLIAEVVGFSGEIVWDTTKPDGTPRKLLDVSKLTSLGWSPQISLRQGISDTYDWYVREQHQELRRG